MPNDTKQIESRFLNYDKPFVMIDIEAELKIKIKKEIVSAYKLIKVADYDTLIANITLEIAVDNIYKLLKDHL